MLMTNHFDQAWKFGDLQFHLVLGDIFKLPVEALVNSEQTDFILSWNKISNTSPSERKCRLASLTASSNWIEGDFIHRSGGQIG